MSIQRHAEHIYNVAARNENTLTQQIMQRRTVQRCPERMRMVQERLGWKLIQDDVKLIVEIVSAQSRDARALVSDEGRTSSRVLSGDRWSTETDKSWFRSSGSTE
ncbi:MAG: hypothetical protein ACPF8W_00770 [Luminiphilus sp.]